jgi:hypothetical protein|eukprot:COSAG01_NODE_1756_length_9317_cov_14.878607_3_plen_48_part_00
MKSSAYAVQLRGVDSLLVAAAGYKRKDPVGEEVNDDYDALMMRRARH